MIIQGTNKPITITFDEQMADIPYLEVALIDKKGNVMKHWSKEDIEFNGKICICNIKQSESVTFENGVCTIEVKWLDTDGVTQFARLVSDKIIPRTDKTIMGETDDTYC